MPPLSGRRLHFCIFQYAHSPDCFAASQLSQSYGYSCFRTSSFALISVVPGNARISRFHPTRCVGCRCNFVAACESVDKASMKCKCRPFRGGACISVFSSTRIRRIASLLRSSRNPTDIRASGLRPSHSYPLSRAMRVSPDSIRRVASDAAATSLQLANLSIRPP